MQLVRPAIASDPRAFGRGRFRTLNMPPISAQISNDMRLFASTFAGGFLFVTLFIA
jgi:hypothetical protein